MNEFSLLDFFDTLDNSRRKVRGISFGCSCEGCNEKTIKKSHLIQQNPFVYSIADENRKVFRICDNEIHPRKSGFGFFKPSITTVKNALCLPLFCSKHDNEIFIPIETPGFNIEDRKNQLLFSYRSLCAQRYLEQKRLAFYEENSLEGELFEYQRQNSEYCIERLNVSIMQLWNDIQTSSNQDYVFKVVMMPRVPICLSDSLIDEIDLWSANDKNKPCNIVFVHMLPFEDVSKLIIGYNKKYVSKTQLKYYDSWKCMYESIDLDSIIKLLLRCNNWCCHPDFFTDKQYYLENWDSEKVKLFIEESLVL